MITPLDLKCEYQLNPSGVDTRHPRLSWILTDSRRGQSQTAFQILAASSPEQLTQAAADLWDTGKVRSPHSMAGYAGVPLTSPMRCYWTVRAWDAQDQPGPFAPTAWFETASLSSADGRVGWVGNPPLEPVCSFSCSDEQLNHIYQAGFETLPGRLEDTEALLYTYDATQAVAQWIGAAAPDRLGLPHLAAAWQLFMLRGDARPMSEHYPIFKAWVDTRTHQVGTGHILQGDPVATACYYYAVLLLYEIAGVTGRAADKEHYAALFDQIDAAFNDTFWEAAAGSYGKDADPLALYHTIVPAGRIQRTVASLVRDAQRPGVPITPYLLEALTTAGRADLAYDLVTRAREPVWRTTSAWILKTIGGITADTDPDYPAFQRFSVRPNPVGGITWANLSLQTIRGPVEAAWQVAPDGALSLSVNVPVGSAGVISLPLPDAGANALSESGVTFWKSGHLLGLPEGVIEVKVNAGALHVTTGSGRYSYQVF